MEKKPRQKKALKVNIDTKFIDVNVVRDASGEVDVTIDTPIVDAHYNKDASGSKRLEKNAYTCKNILIRKKCL